jgi:hypothetical protein
MMHQKYLISIDLDSNMLKIREYAIIDKIPKNTFSLSQAKTKYELLCEETYNLSDVILLISRGKNALISAIRTKNFFPIEPYAKRICETVKNLYQSSSKNAAELFFNDIELLPDRD